MCLDGESDFENIMAGNFESLGRMDCSLRFNEVTRWAWEAWRLAVGVKVGNIFPDATAIMNAGAKQNGIYNLNSLYISISILGFILQIIGYCDIGVVWREEIELPDLRGTVDQLMTEIKPFYNTLHAVIRAALWQKVHTFDDFNPQGMVPAHLLGT